MLTPGTSFRRDGYALKIECFMPDWPGPKQHVQQNFGTVGPFCPVTILCNPNDYFNAQWEKARQQFTGDVLLWIMADVTLPENFGELYSEMQRVMQRGDIGWYAPDAAWTSFIYDKKTLKQVEPYIYEVPNTDSLCFAIRGDVVRAMPTIDSELCFMWGMDFTAIATASLMNLKTVRDYKFKVQHPNSTGYDIDQASLGMKNLFESYPPVLRDEINRIIAIANKLKVKP
jgi:hypothetical protein